MNCLWHQCTNVSTSPPWGHCWKPYGMPPRINILFPALYALYRPLRYNVCAHNRIMDRLSEHMAIWNRSQSKCSSARPLQPGVLIGIHYHSLELGGACFEKVITANWYNPLHYKSADGILGPAQWSLKCNLTFLPVRRQYCISPSLLLGCTGDVLSPLCYLAGAIRKRWRLLN